MLKKIDRNCFLCYKKSFLSYSIFNLHLPNNSSGCCLCIGRSFSILAHFLSACQAFLITFSDFFENFLFSFNRYLSDFLSLETACISYHKLPCLVNCFWDIFLSFFRFFSKSCRTSFQCPVRFRQLVYPITNGFICQLFFGIFFRFFRSFFRSIFVFRRSLRSDSSHILSHFTDTVNCFYPFFAIFFGFFCLIF